MHDSSEANDPGPEEEPGFEIPESWPPPEEEEQAVQEIVAPLFPLARVWLHPGVVMPLHIFEPRYRSMIEDSLDGPGRLVIGTVTPANERSMQGAPPCYPIAGLGEIGRHERLPDGRFHIWLVGLSRVSLREIESPHDYRLVRATTLVEEDCPSQREDELRAALVEAVQARTPGELNLPEQTPIGRLADLLLMHLPLATQARQELFGVLPALQRAEAVLEHHAEPPFETPEDSFEDADD